VPRVIKICKRLIIPNKVGKGNLAGKTKRKIGKTFRQDKLN